MSAAHTTKSEKTPASQGLTKAKRVVIKVGSALLVDDAHGTVHRKWLESLADGISQLKNAGKEVVVVSSGAIAVGRRHLGFGQRALKLEEQQAAAATGQLRLAHAYQEVLHPFDITVGQVLLTLDDTENRRRYINARNTLDTLLKAGAVPLINENDTVSTAEIRFGDNDRLAARVAAMISADVLILFSDINGLYSSDPTQDETAELIAEVSSITPEIMAMAGKARTQVGSGGMITKLAAAEICLSAGCHMVIASGKEMDPVGRVMQGELCTWFKSTSNPSSARKRWISGHLKPVGALVVDDGAQDALAKGKSLLPAGIVDVEGRFDRGDAVAVKLVSGREIACGLVAYNSDDVRAIMGRKSAEIESVLGYRRGDAMIHRDDLVLR